VVSLRGYVELEIFGDVAVVIEALKDQNNSVARLKRINGRKGSHRTPNFRSSSPMAARELQEGAGRLGAPFHAAISHE
jgi:hypothetical protein